MKHREKLYGSPTKVKEVAKSPEPAVAKKVAIESLTKGVTTATKEVIASTIKPISSTVKSPTSLDSRVRYSRDPSNSPKKSSVASPVKIEKVVIVEAKKTVVKELPKQKLQSAEVAEFFA